MGFPRQQYWRGLSFPPPGALPHPRIEYVSLTYSALAGKFFTTSITWETPYNPIIREKVVSLSIQQQECAGIWKSLLTTGPSVKAGVVFRLIK